MSKLITTLIHLKGATCKACQKIIEKRILKIKGVYTAIVYLNDGKTEITAERQISKSEIKNTLKGTKYEII